MALSTYPPVLPQSLPPPSPLLSLTTEETLNPLSIAGFPLGQKRKQKAIH